MVRLKRADVLRLFPERPAPEFEGPFYATSMWQDKVWELDPKHYDQSGILQFRLPYAERQPGLVDDADYAAVNDRWIAHASELARPTAKEVGQFLNVQRSPWLMPLLMAAATNAPVAEGVRRVVAGAIKYSQRYGETLDFMGENNVIITREGQVRILDVLTPRESDVLGQMPAALAKVANAEGLTRKEVLVLLNCLGHIRNMNFLAAWLGMPERLHIEVPQLSTADWGTVQRVVAGSTPTKYLLATTVAYA